MAQANAAQVRILKLLGALAVSAVALALAVGAWGWAQATATQEAQGAGISVGPDSPLDSVSQEMAPGYTKLSFESAADNGDTLTLYRLKSGATVDELRPALEAIDLAFSGQGDPGEAMNAALELADIVAELDLEPGQSQSVGVELTEGDYVLDYAPHTAEEGALPQRSFRTITVSGERHGEAPAADVEIEMVDFAFEMPESISAGEQVWRVSNTGEQLHHMVLFRLNEDATLEEMMAWMETEEGPPPGESAGYVGILSPGFSVDYTMDLQPGRYVAICFMPDHRGDATGMPHFMLGMVQEFEVVGE